MSAMWANDWVFDAWDNYNAIASPGWFMWHGNSPVDPNASIINVSFARLNDGLYYASPEFGGGFSFDASYGTRVREGDQNQRIGNPTA